MRTSILIASHNEGDLLWRTVGSCRETTADLDCEIVVADDASADGCVARMQERFPDVRVVTFPQRRGVAATKDLAARSSSGETFLFLDAHCKPEPGAIRRLVEDVVNCGRQSIVSPVVLQLDPVNWQCDFRHAGYSYWIDLKSFDNRWQDRGALRRVRGPGGRSFYEQACVVGCCVAMARGVYERLRGFDVGMLSYGSEDIDFGLRAWQMGYSLLCDPRALIGHRFSPGQSGYAVPREHYLYNELRMARKNLGDPAWTDWVKQHQDRAGQPLWSAAWKLFERDLRSVELERDFLLANRVRDEFAYARRFGLGWPLTPPSFTSAFPDGLSLAEKGPERPIQSPGGGNPHTKVPPPRHRRRPRRQETETPPAIEPTKAPPPDPTRTPPPGPTKTPPPEPTRKLPPRPTKTTPTMPKKSSPAKPKKSSPGKPEKSSSPAKPKKSSPAKPKKSSSPAKPKKSSPARPEKSSSPAKPKQSSPGKPEKSSSPAKPKKSSPGSKRPKAR